MTSKSLKNTIIALFAFSLGVIGLGIYFLTNEQLKYLCIYDFSIAGILLISAIVTFIYGKTKHIFMSSKGFLDKVHEGLNVLGYNESLVDFDYDKFVSVANNTICRTKDLDAGRKAIKAFGFVDSNLKKLFKVAAKHIEYWDSLKYYKSKTIKLASEYDSFDVLYLTNAITPKFDKVFLFGSLLEGDYEQIQHDNGRYYINDEQCSYFLRYSKISSSEMVIEDDHYNKILTISLSDNFALKFVNNKTEYDCFDFGNEVLGIYKKSDIKSKPEKNKVLPKCQTMIYWDIIDKNDPHGLARLEIYTDINDGAEDVINISLLVAISTFLIYKKMEDAHLGAIASITASTTAVRTHHIR